MENHRENNSRDIAVETPEPTIKVGKRQTEQEFVADDGCGCCTPPPPKKNNSAGAKKEKKDSYVLTVLSLLLLLGGIVLDWQDVSWFEGYIRLAVFGLAYVLVGWKVIWYAGRSIARGDVFSEFFLMTIATFGAFYLGEFAEGVAVMLFYVIGEHFQESAVARSRRSIKELIDNRPEEVQLIRNGQAITVNPRDVKVGEVIRIRAGEKVALDGTLLSEEASFNTAALTGESRPDRKTKGEKVLAGMINLDKVAELRVTSLFEDSTLSGILKLVEQAAGRKAKTQQFISKFAKVYTPIIVFLALSLTFLPYFFVENYVFNEWLYRALVFLVISCPCALVVSIPLGYFGGIGAASRNGILFKGASFLDSMAGIDTVVMDKTGTLTEGVFQVQEVQPNRISEAQLLRVAAALESHSSHPVAKAVVAYAGNIYAGDEVKEVEEIAGHGLKGKVNGKEVLVGNAKLLQKFNISYDSSLDSKEEGLLLVAIDKVYAGYLSIADKVKEDAAAAIEQLHQLGVKTTVMLSGDKDSIVQKVARELKIDKAYGGLLPQDKVSHFEALQQDGKKIAFVGDGINDAPVIALADVGIAMGGLGSDAAIETADVVIQTDQPAKIATAIRLGKKTKQIVWQNIALAFGVKILVLSLGAFGIASLWEAVFADVGVALLAILNAIRIQRMKF
ncbi:heavy metal translocating P-type ATPase [Nafulsella turpanensis]|uniref:heavy metal translocating P-type ATPase n=1 Tax=Nafulsella turpanensis TaxID=1265690 RepID=UPI0003483FC3|nr:heavy metal translocating P-type ATPase [Nafulsella turpanensis]